MASEGGLKRMAAGAASPAPERDPAAEEREAKRQKTAFHASPPTAEEATRSSVKAVLTAADRTAFIRHPDAAYRLVGRSDPPQQVVPDLIWTTARLLNASECQDWIAKATAAEFEDGDFIFRMGSEGYEREPTGGRRNSGTIVVEDAAFSELFWARLKDLVSPTLPDGRTVVGIPDRFLVSRYHKEQYFAPRFDGNMEPTEGRLRGTRSAATVVLYLTEDFVGGATHYLPGPGSKVPEAVAVTPAQGHAVIHQQEAVLHCGGQVEDGTKYIMQVGLMYTKTDAQPLGQELKWAV